MSLYWLTQGRYVLCIYYKSKGGEHKVAERVITEANATQLMEKYYDIAYQNMFTVETFPNTGVVIFKRKDLGGFY